MFDNSRAWVGDHSKYYKEYAKYGVAIYSNPITAKHLEEKYHQYVRGLAVDRHSRIVGGYVVVPFSVPHEDIANTGYLIQFPNGQRMLYCTDFHYIDQTFAAWKIDHFLIAVNHSEFIPEEAHARDHRIRGHSDLNTVKNFISTSMTDRCKSVTACHLSSVYADPERIEQELKELCGDGVDVNIAHKGMKITLREG